MLNLALLNWSGSLNFHVLPLWSCRCQAPFISRFCKVMICIPLHWGYYRRLCLHSMTQLLTVLEIKYLFKTLHVAKMSQFVFFNVTHVFKQCPCNNELYLERYDITAVNINNTTFWDVTWCGLVKIYRCFGGTCCFHLRYRK